MSYRKLLPITIGIFLVFGSLHVASFGFLENTHLKIRDLFFRLRGPLPTNSQIAIIAIDDQSIAHYGRWPWPRARIGSLIHRLTEADARTIGIDISFLPSHSQARPVAPDEELTSLLEWLKLDRSQHTSYSNDQLLALALEKADNVVLPFYFEFKGSSVEGTPAMPAYLSHSAYLLFDDPSRLPSLPLLRGSTVFPPTPVLAEAAAALGCVNAYLDWDGVLRNDPAIISYRDQYFPSLGIQLARLYLGLSWAEVKVNSGESIVLGNHVVPIDNRGFVGLNYCGGRESFPYLSYKNVMEGKIKPELLRDKLILVGVVAAGLHDLWSTPFGPGYPGVEKHATVIANILDDRFISRSDIIAIGEVAFMLCGALALVLVAGSRRSWLLWLSCFFLLGLQMAASYWALAVHNLWFKPLFPALLIFSLSLLLQLFLPIRAPKRVKETRLQPVETVVGDSFEVPSVGETVGRYQIESE
jgi:adenylate cyclase